MTTTIEDIAQLERQLHDLSQRLAEARREAPSQPIATEYTFHTASGGTTSLRDLFAEKDDLIVIHNMGESCVYCTLWADGFNGLWQHAADRASFVLISKDEPAQQRAFAEQRAWAFPIASAAGTSFFKDMGFEGEDGKPWPGVSAFHRNADGSIVRTGRAPFGPGDQFCSLWHLLDLLPGGPGEWTPKYRY